LTLQQKLKYSGKAYILGSASLAAELSRVGVTAVGIGVSINTEANVGLSEGCQDSAHTEFCTESATLRTIWGPAQN